jgi:hypothetical protein
LLVCAGFLLVQPRHGAALRGRGRREPLPAGPDQVNDTTGARGDEIGVFAAPRLVDSGVDVDRAAWRSAASNGTRARAPGWAVICALAAGRRPSWRSREVIGGRLNRVLGWPLWIPAEVMRIEPEW